MANITYERTFQHDDWIDNEDVVQAGGEKGFNGKFHAIEDEFDSLAQVVQQINTALITIGAQVAAPITIGLVPDLLPFGSQLKWSAINWSRFSGGSSLGTYVELPNNQTEAWGVLPLNLPDGAEVISLKVLGEKTGNGDVKTELFKESRTKSFLRSLLIDVNGLATVSAPPTNLNTAEKVDNGANLYYLLTSIQNATTSTQVFLRGFQVTYIA